MDFNLQLLEALSFNTQLVIWACAVLFFLVAEGSTLAMVAIWFFVGALAAFIAVLAGCTFLTQIITFVVISTVMFIFMRPIAVVWLNVKDVPMNVNSIVGMKGVITEDVNNLMNKGRARVNGLEWSASSEDGSSIPAGTVIEVRQVQGVTIVVTKAEP